MSAFGWEVVGSVAGVVAAAAAIIGLVPVLRGRRQVPEPPSVAGDEALPAAGGEHDPVVVGKIPREPLGFQPRADLLAALDAPRTASRVVVQAVTGMRGVGKTHLAAAYARAKLAEPWRLVAWINAEDLGGVLGGLAEVAAGLGLGAIQEDAAATGLAVRHWLETGGHRCLLVFDDATDPELLEPFLPAAGAARVIITSNQWVANLGASMPVAVFSEPEAVAFLDGRTASADPEGARAVAAELGYLPLALAQAAAVIAGQHLGFGTYLDMLRGMPVSDLLTPVKAGQYPRGVAAAVMLSLEGVRAADDTGVCTAVMALLAVLSPGGVRRTLVRQAARQGVLSRDGQSSALGSEVADQALGRLAEASLLTFSMDDASVSVHRLVMRVIREYLAADNSLTAVCVAVAELLDGVAGSLRETWHQDRTVVRDLVDQITALYQSSAACLADSTLVRRVLSLRLWAVFFLNELGDSTAQSIVIAEPLLTEMERVLGTDHPDTLTSRNHLANAYQEAGRAAEAIPLLERTLADRERVLGADHPDTLRTRNDLALGYKDAGRAAEAIPLLERTLADRERVLGADHPDTLRTRSNLALAVYQSAGRMAAAIPLLERALADSERVLGADHPDTLRTRSNLAAAYQAAGWAAKASPLLVRTLADSERVLNTDHPETPTSPNKHTLPYWITKRMAEAIPVLELVLANLERLLDNDHPEPLTSRNKLALAYQAARQTAKAIPQLERTLADNERVLGPDHPETLTSRNKLALGYQAARQTAKAIPLLERTLADNKRVLGADHPDTLRSRSHLALACQAAGRITEAIPLHEQTLAAFERVLGSDHPDTLRSHNNLALAYQSAGQTAKAIPLLERTLADSERVLGADHPFTKQFRENLATLMNKSKRHSRS